MECKVIARCVKHPVIGRFNRDIVECKEVHPINFFEKSSGFNRDIVECKVSLSMLTSSARA